MRLAEAILRFERHLAGAMKLKDMDVSDYLVYNSLAMECFQAVNSLIDIGELEAIKRLIFLRNMIAHEYHRIGKEDLIEMANLLNKVKNFVSRIKSAEGGELKP